MRVYSQAQGTDVWKVVENKYDVPANPPIDTHGNKLYKDNSKEMNAILVWMRQYL